MVANGRQWRGIDRKSAMQSHLKHNVSLLWRAEFCSPKDFVRRALLISIASFILHLAGLKDFTTILNGTMGSVELGWGMSAFLGLIYICAWLGFVVLVPILLLAAVLLAVWNRVLRSSHGSSQSNENHRSRSERHGLLERRIESESGRGQPHSRTFRSSHVL